MNSTPAPHGWTTAPLRDLVQRKFTGPSPTCEERQVASDEEWGLLKTTAITWDGWNEAAHKVPPRQYWGNRAIEVHANDVLITKAGPRHRVGVVVHVRATQPRIMVSGKMVGLRPRNDIVLPAILAGLLSLNEAQDYLNSRTTGMAESQTNFADEALMSTPLKIPPMSEQRRIAEILDSADDQIRFTKRIRHKLMLGKAGLVRDLTQGDFPLGRLGDLAQLVTSGSRGWADYYSEEGAKFIRIGNLTRSHINLRLDSLVRVAVPGGTEGSRTSLLPGDILISITADLGIVGVVPAELGEAYINQHIALVRVDQTQVNPRWVGHFLSSPRGQLQFQRLNDQGAKAGLNLPAVANLNVALPSLEEQARAVAVLDQTDARIAQLDFEISKLGQFKLGLMDDLLTGRVRLPEGAVS